MKKNNIGPSIIPGSGPINETMQLLIEESFLLLPETAAPKNGMKNIFTS